MSKKERPHTCENCGLPVKITRKNMREGKKIFCKNCGKKAPKKEIITRHKEAIIKESK